MKRLLACLLLACSTAALGQAWPSKPVRIVVAYPPGGGIDVMARQLADKLQPSWGQPVVVENKPGANTIVATDAVIPRCRSVFFPAERKQFIAADTYHYRNVFAGRRCCG